MDKKLLLIFTTGKQRFAIDAHSIAEIIPLLDITKVPKTKPYITGVCNYRGQLIPLIDTGLLLFNEECEKRTCTRIIVIQQDFGQGLVSVGLIAEKVYTTNSFNLDDGTEHNLTNGETSYLKKILQDEQGEIQYIDINKLIPDEAKSLRATLKSA